MINLEEDKIITAYSFDQNNVYCGHFEYHWAKGTGLAANSTNIQPPEFSEGFIPVFIDNDWEIQQDHRGKTVYSITNQSQSKIDYVGEIHQGWTLLEPIEFGEWNGSEWVDNRTLDQIAKYARSLMPQLTPIEFDIKLVDAGLYDQVQELIQSDIKLKIAYTRATFFSRTDHFIDQARIALNLTDEQVDTIWESSLV